MTSPDWTVMPMVPLDQDIEVDESEAQATIEGVAEGTWELP